MSNSFQIDSVQNLLAQNSISRNQYTHCLAASANIAFGIFGYYDAITGEQIGEWPLPDGIYSFCTDGQYSIAFDKDSKLVLKYLIGEPAGPVIDVNRDYVDIYNRVVL